MEKFELITPTMEYKSQAIQYIDEFNEHKSYFNGVGGLNKYVEDEDYDGWIKKLDRDRNLVPNEEEVPTETYFFVRKSDNKIIGMVNIRLTLNEKLKDIGHIGYSIRPTERRKGYNKVNLYLALQKCRDAHNMTEVLMECSKENLGSVKTIQALGGILLREFYEENIKEIFQHYTIDINNSLRTYKDLYGQYVEEFV